MEFSRVFINSACTIFLSNEIISSANWCSQELSLENNNVFNRFLVTEVRGDEIDVPVIARRKIETVLTNKVIDNDISNNVLSTHRIVLPLYENTIPQEKRTFNSFIKQFFTKVTYINRLQKLTSSNGDVYYGGRGLIFDGQYNPLILCTLRARKKVQENGIFRMAYFKPIIYVNPIVFTEPNKLINKGIIKQIIPYYTERGVSFPSMPYGMFTIDSNITQDSGKAIVIVDNLDRFFVKPTVPKPQSHTNESMNECLVNNIDDVLSML